MQAMMNSNAFAPTPRLQFARRGYMVRSEKRRRPEPKRPSAEGSGRPPRGRRPRAGFFYKLFMVILLLTLWPIGLIMLWNRRLRWGTLTKLFTTVITLMACILLIGTALTVRTTNPTLSAAQDKVNGVLDTAADGLVDFSIHMGERVQLSLESLDELNALYQQQSLLQAADVIDRGVEIAQNLRERAGELFASSDSGDATEATPEPELEIDPENVPDLETDAEDSDAEDSAAPTSAPAVGISVSTEDEELPVYIPGSAPGIENGVAVVSGTLTRAGTLEEATEPEPTPEPTPEVLSFAVKPAAEATVYFNNGGKFYHMNSSCGSMQNAAAHALGETADTAHEPCTGCKPPAKALLEETYIVWLDAGNVAHLSDECADFQGQWSIASADTANEESYTGCPTCGADSYLAALADGLDVVLESAATEPEEDVETEETAETEGTETEAEETVETEAEAEDEEASATEEPEAEDTPEPTTEPTPEATAEPEVRVVKPSAALKPAAEAVVYHTSNGKFYHMAETCTNMSNAKPYTLAECVDNFKRCNTCSAPAVEMLEQMCLWEDEDAICHVSDECENFKGRYTLIERDAALEQGLTACDKCGAEDYLIPYTTIDTSETPDEVSSETTDETSEETPEDGEASQE